MISMNHRRDLQCSYTHTVRILAMTNGNCSQLLSYSLSEEQEKGHIISQYCHGDNRFYTCSHITVGITTCFSVPVSRFQPMTYPSVEHSYESLELIVFLCLLKKLIHLCQYPIRLYEDLSWHSIFLLFIYKIIDDCTNGNSGGVYQSE